MKRMSASNKNPLTTRARNLETLAAWTGISSFATADRDVAMWYEDNRKTIHDKVESLKTDGVAFDVASLLRSNSKGGLKGGKARAAKLTPEERSEAARKAATARWKKET